MNTYDEDDWGAPSRQLDEDVPTPAPKPKAQRPLAIAPVPAASERTEAARLLASLRRKVTTACAGCGKDIAGTTRRKWCSPACQAKAWYAANPRPHRRRGQAEGGDTFAGRQ